MNFTMAIYKVRIYKNVPLKILLSCNNCSAGRDFLNIICKSFVVNLFALIFKPDSKPENILNSKTIVI